MSALLAAIWPYLAAAGGVLAALGVAWAKGKRDERMAEAARRATSWAAAEKRASDAADRYRADGGAGERLRGGKF